MTETETAVLETLQGVRADCGSYASIRQLQYSLTDLSRSEIELSLQNLQEMSFAELDEHGCAKIREPGVAALQSL